MTQAEKPPSALLKAVSIALALIAPARMAWIVFTNGENNLSNDYVGRIPLVASMLDGTCSIAKFVREAWVVGGHSLIVLTPIYYLNARFFGWSVWFELGLGLALTAATLTLLAAATPRSTRWLLLPLLSLLLFSTSRVTVFTFGEPALQYGFSQLGIAIGVFALARWPARDVRLALTLALGGILASWSWGGGLMAWPVFMGALLFLRVRTFRAWAILFSGAAVGVVQYVWILFFAGDPAAMKTLPSLRLRAVLDLLGRTFIDGIARDYGPSLASQAVGLAGLIVLAALLFRRPRTPQCVPALALIGWTLLVALQITVFRSEAAPWYVSPMALFWVGLAVLISLSRAPFPTRTAGLSLIAFLALRVQRSWEDKSFYLPSRSPASAACLREWRSAPAACHERLFQWGGKRVNETEALGMPLEQRGLSVFSAHRTYLLQGDIAVGRVSVGIPNVPAFLSSDGLSPADPNDFHRLDLVLAPSATVSWKVDIPANVRVARFATSARATPNDSKAGRAVQFVVTSKESHLQERVFIPKGFSRPITIDLARLAGQSIRLEIHSEEAGESALPLRLGAPRIEMEIAGRPEEPGTRKRTDAGDSHPIEEPGQ